MDKTLRLYTYIDGVNDTPFPSEENHAILTSFQYDSKRMGGAPTISATLMHEQCLDKLWTYNVYAQFNGERYFVKQIPSSQFSNTEVLYKHEIELVSERVILDNVYFYDVVSSEAENDKPVSNSTEFTFFGDIHEFAKRLNYSLQYRKVGYSVVVDDGISSEGKMVSFEDTVFSNAIQESYNTYEIPYYFVGKVIHFGFTDNAITKTFKYGADESLLSIQKQNANYKVVTRITGTGSSDNIPYYYPNDSEQGDITLLYNGAENDNVYISDKVKFSNFHLDNKLVYTYIPSEEKELMSGLTVQSYVDISDDTSDERIFEFSLMSKFTMPAASPINISFVIGNNKETHVRITNSSGTEQASRTITKTADSISMQLGSGVFTLTMTARVAIPEGVNIASMAEAQEWVNNRISASAKHTSQSVGYWTLRDSIILLADYGLELSSGFTPTNGDYITIRQDNYIQPSDKLLPPIYRQTNGTERFYEAKNNTYINPQTGEYYHFNNEFVEGNPKEHIVSFDNIKPTIKGMTNALGYRIDMFQEFAYDLNDNDDTYPEGSEKAGEYIHPYFYAKLRKFDGDYGFNLFDHAIDEGEMTISMTSGNCGACEWVIGVDENTNKNIVQVDGDGNLYRDEQGNVLLGAPQDRQNDTQNYEVWIALKKDINTFGVVMPNATYNYKPSVNDTFVILHIDLPKAYVLAAENRLKEELIKYMAENNDEKFNFSISFSRIFFTENPDILAKLNENARLQIEYDGMTYELYVSSYSYKMSNDSPLPEIQVELSDTLTISQNSLQTAIDKVEQDIMHNVGSIDWLKLGLAYFLRKDVDDRSKGAIASDKQIEVGRYVSGVSGAIIYVDKQTGQTIGELDKLYVRMKAYFEQLEIVNVNSVGGKQIISPAGAVRCRGVLTQPDWDYYRCYFLSEQDGEKIENRFNVGDQAYSSMFNAREGVENNITNHYYWRLVVGIGEDYIDLSKSDCDTGSDIPKEDDVIVHRGNRNDVDRQNFIEFSSVDSFSPSITLYQGVNSYSLADKEVVQFGVNKATGKAFMNVYGDMYLGNRDGSAYISYTPEGGLKIKGTLDIGTNFGDKTLKDTIDAAGNVYKEDLSLLQATINNDINNLQSQIDGAIETWFFNPIPTLTNAPAKDWTTDEQKNTHLGDLYYNAEGRAYRFQLNADTNVYYWNEIVDTDIKKALENAKKAQDTADGKRKIFVRQPQHGESYDIGDMWVNATYPSDGSKYKEDMLRAVTANDGTQPFDIAHWQLASKYTDDTVANKALDSATKANEAVQNLKKGVKDFKDNVEGAFRDGIIDESETQALDANMKQIGALKDQVEKSYDDVSTNSLLAGSTELTILGTAKNAFLTACQELLDEVSAAISDKVISDTERIRVNAKYDTFNTKYGDYNKALNACIRYVEEKLNESISTYSYLKEALKQETTIAGGLVQTTSLVLGYKGSDGAYNVMAGSNGLVTAKGNKTPAFWMGGDMIDLFDVYNSSTGEFDREAGVRYAQGMDRMDGTGYRANGNLWWDSDGRVHADPLSFFVGENTVGALLASFQVVLKADGVHPDYLIPQVPFQSLTIADTLRIGEALVKYDATNKAVYVTHPDGSTDTIGFYAEGWVSAKGVNSSSSGGGGGASALYQLVDVLANSTNDGVLNATNGSVLMYNGSKWQAGNVVTDISPLTLNVNGSNLFTYNGKSSITANLTVPTKVSQLTNDSGYLTTITKAQVEGVLTGNITSHTHSYLPLSGGTISNNTRNLLLIKNTDSTGSSALWLGGAFNTFSSGAIVEYNGSNGGLYFINFKAYTNNNQGIGAFRITSDNKIQCGDVNWAYSVYDMLHSGNYNSYSPTLTGTGASGTWGISITGNAATASKWATARTLSLTGSVTGSVSFNGSSNATLTTYTNHTHDYLPLTGGTLSGLLNANGVRIGRNFIINNRAGIRLDSNGDYPADILFGHTAQANEDSWRNVDWAISSRCSTENKVFGIWRAEGNGGEEPGIIINTNLNIKVGETNSYFSTDRGYKLWVNGTLNAVGQIYQNGTPLGSFAFLNSISTSSVSEGSNLYFTNERAISACDDRYLPEPTKFSENLKETTSWRTFNSNTETGIGFKRNGVSIGFVGAYNDCTYLCVSDSSKAKYLKIYPNGYITWDNNIIYHAGNSNKNDVDWTVKSLSANAASTINSRDNGAPLSIYSTATDISYRIFLSNELSAAFGYYQYGTYMWNRVAGRNVHLSNSGDFITSGNVSVNAGENPTYTLQVGGQIGVFSSVYNTVRLQSTNQECSIIFAPSGSTSQNGHFVAGAHTSGEHPAWFIYDSALNKQTLRIENGRCSINNGALYPEYNLYVNGNFAGEGYRLGKSVAVGNRANLLLNSNSNTPSDIIFRSGNYTNNTYGDWALSSRGNENGNNNFYIARGGYNGGTAREDCIIQVNHNGYVAIGQSVFNTTPSAQLHVIGDIAATGAVTAKASSSDIRLKTDISDYKALSIIRGHKSIKYHWNEVAKANADIFNDDYWHYGLIAQDVQRDMPQMVSDVFKDYLVINYERLIPICWKGLQEVDDEVTKLKKKVRKLEMEIRELKQERA